MSPVGSLISRSSTFFYWCAPYEIAELPEPTGARKIVAYNVLCGALDKNPSTHVSVLPANAMLEQKDIGNAMVAKGFLRVLTSPGTSDLPPKPWLLVQWQGPDAVEIKLSDGVLVTKHARKIGSVTVNIVSK